MKYVSSIFAPVSAGGYVRNAGLEGNPIFYSKGLN